LIIIGNVYGMNVLGKHLVIQEELNFGKVKKSEKNA
tara:strand:- start:105 stop:212 length:108 start_codon:yes stop_codon:yes gene_type:complete